jgi:hypothetical protein
MKDNSRVSLIHINEPPYARRNIRRLIAKYSTQNERYLVSKVPIGILRIKLARADKYKEIANRRQITEKSSQSD